MVMDLSTLFGHSSTEYGMTAQYIESLVKRYRNECLFVFMYNMDDPGFAYSILPNLKKYVIPVTLREGTGDRRQAVAYMKALIRESDYAEYANQATEFMKQFPGETFTQTDVLMAYEQFEAWCLNKNVLLAYDCDSYENSFGDEAINTIVQEMENHRDDVIVIFAGYPEPMKQFLDRNPGMQSRIAFQIEFEDYTTEELCAITRLMLAKKQLTITEAAMNRLECIYNVARKDSDYGNGRFVRKMLEEAEMNLAERIMGADSDSLTMEAVSTIEESDIPEYRAKECAKVPIGF